MVAVPVSIAFRLGGERDREAAHLISRIIFRAILVVVAFFVAVAVSLAVLFALGAIWSGNELSAAAPQGSVTHQAAPTFGVAPSRARSRRRSTRCRTARCRGRGSLRIRSWMGYVWRGACRWRSFPFSRRLKAWTWRRSWPARI